MKTLSRASHKALNVLLQALCLLLFLASCTNDPSLTTDKGPTGARTGVQPNVIQCPVGQHYDFTLHQCVDDPVCQPGYSFDPSTNECVPDATSVDCSQITNVESRERSRAVAAYGANGGTLFDQVMANTDPNTTVLNYNQAVYSYMRQIQSAISDGGDAYANSFGTCDNCTATYDSGVLLNYINNYINPLKNTITNDGALSSNDRNLLLGAIQAIYDNYNEVGQLVEGHSSCFPNPSWYVGSPNARGFFSGLVKTLKKVVNIVVTVLVTVVVDALVGAAIGIGLGPLAAEGLIVGAFAGLVRGIFRCINGDYICVFKPCP